jgi:hypothetical protein
MMPMQFLGLSVELEQVRQELLEVFFDFTPLRSRYRFEFLSQIAGIEQVVTLLSKCRGLSEKPSVEVVLDTRGRNLQFGALCICLAVLHKTDGITSRDSAGMNLKRRSVIVKPA